MMRKIIALAATALLCSLIATSAASARMGGGHFGGMGGHPGGMGGFHGGMGGFRAAPMGGFRAGPAFAHRSVAFHHPGFAHNRFFFRHHRFHRFASPFFFASVVDDGCFVARPVWTPWGWRWRRIWVCG
jgi:hypothetical protein